MLKRTLSAITLSIVLASLASPVFAIPNERVEADADVLAAEFQEGDIITAKKFNHMIKILKLLRERVSRLESALNATSEHLLEVEKRLDAKAKPILDTNLVTPTTTESTPLIYIYRSAP